MNAARTKPARKKATKPAKIGRPFSTAPTATRQIGFRVTDEQRERYHAAAAAADLPLTTWIEQQLDRAAPPAKN